MTSADPPRTPSEVELYRVLDQARLLSYYPTFIAQGGDDVSQLAEASEEEFNEILNLVGMARKVLHIRRLQKVLNEWRNDRSPFQRPILPFDSASGSAPVTIPDPGVMPFPPAMPSFNDIPLWPPPPAPQGLKNFPVSQPPHPNMCAAGPMIASVSSSSLASLGEPSMALRSPMEGQGVPVSLLPNVTLSARQLEMISQGAADLSRVLPPYPPREVNAKKQVSRAITAILTMSPDDPKRESEVRLYSPIYGRFDSPRRTGRAMTFHEVAVNEAAAQLCLHRSSLLTRRDDLFCLARQVVKMMEQNFHASSSVLVKNEEGTEGTENGLMCAPCPDAPACSPDDIQKLQLRLQVLSSDLGEVVAQQDNARGIMRRNKADQTLCVEMQHELDQLSHRQTKIANEQAMIIAQLRRNGSDMPGPSDMWVKSEAVDRSELNIAAEECSQPVEFPRPELITPPNNL